MTQDEYNRLFIRLIDDFQWIKWYQEYLVIALEQLDNPGDKALERIELLLSSYLQATEAHFESANFWIERRDSISDNRLTDS